MKQKNSALGKIPKRSWSGNCEIIKMATRLARSRNPLLSIGRWLRSSGSLPFLMKVAEEDKTQGKEAKHKRVFFRFGNDGAVHSDAQALICRNRSKTAKNRVARTVAVVCAGRGNVKIANRLGHRPGANPAGGYPAAAVVEVAAVSNTRADVIPTRARDIVQEHIGDGAAGTAKSKRRHIGGGAGNGDVVVGVSRSQFDGLPQPSSQRLEV